VRPESQSRLLEKGQRQRWLTRADVIVDELGAVEPYSAEGAAAKDEVITAQWSWSKEDCLNRQGVSAWVVTSLSVTATTIFSCARTS